MYHDGEMVKWISLIHKKALVTDTGIVVVRSVWYWLEEMLMNKGFDWCLTSAEPHNTWPVCVSLAIPFEQHPRPPEIDVHEPQY